MRELGRQSLFFFQRFLGTDDRKGCKAIVLGNIFPNGAPQIFNNAISSVVVNNL
jgi:hypothetical protein